MAFLAQTSSFCRYKLQEEVSDEFWQDFPEKLLQYRFRDIDNTNDERSFGWVNIDNMLDVNWEQSPPYKGEFAAFALRLDTRRISPAVFKKHFRLAWNDLLQKKQEQGKKNISKQEKNDLKETVRSRLMGYTFPVPAVFDVVWNRDSNCIYFGSTRQKVKELFEELFYNSFGLSLVSLSPYYLAGDLLGEKYREELDNYEPCVFV